MKLLNVRLRPEDARMVALLRRDGVQISRVVRDAIRAAYERHALARTRRGRASEIMADIYREHPDPPERDLRNRRSVRRAIRERLRLHRS